MAVHVNNQHTAGTYIGASCGIVKGVAHQLPDAFLSSISPDSLNTILTSLSFDAMLETALYAFIGATVGFFTTTFWKYIKLKITKRKDNDEVL